ncbi:uncharacterized protein [Palaemon carinicauda]|uniref:uncharacterized protein n=1 Tax=Palaemon carinicauda TaxID=392227 RepID=UPI0035B5A145
MYLETEYYKGTVKLAIVDSLPFPGIDMLFANDLVLHDEANYFPILSVTELEDDRYLDVSVCEPTSVITRSRAREIDLDNVNLNFDDINGQTTDTMTSSCSNSSSKNILFNDVEWEVEVLKEAQANEFSNFDDSNFDVDVDDLSKPVFLKEGGLVYRVSRSVNAPADQAEVRKQLVIPERYRSKLLISAHENNLAGHFGVKKTFQKLSEHFFWPGMRRDVKRHVLSCKVCQLVGKPNQKIPKAPLIPIPSVGEPFREVIIDVVGPLPRTREGHEYILTMVDRMSRFPEAVPLRSIRGEEIFEALVGFFTRFCIPKIIQSDYGMNFTSCEWDKEIPYALFEIRSTPNETLGFSPFQLIFGHCVRGPLDVVREHWEGKTADMNVLHYLSNLQEKLHRAWTFARENLTKAQATMKTNYDVGTQMRHFDPGHRVLVLLPMPGNPLKARFSGPWKVLKKLNNVNYLIETPERRRKTQICHINVLKPFVSREVVVDVEPVSLVEVEVDPMVDIKLSVGPDGLSNNSNILNNLDVKFQHLEKDKATSLTMLINGYKDLFQDVPGRTNILENDVDVGEASPIKQSPYRLNPFKRDIVKDEVKYMLDHGLVEPSFSPWSSPVVLVKKEGGEHRLCFDYRKVNSLTKTDSFPLPRVVDCIDRVGSAKYISKFDLLKGYWQVGLSPRARKISAFVTVDGLYECKVMSFGMKNAAATFQRLMNFITCDLEGCIVYIDDLIIYSEDWETHLKRIRALFEILRKAGLVVNLRKSDFAQAKVIYLGHEIGLATDASDVGLGAVLIQRLLDGTTHTLAYFSKKLLPAERKYSTVEKEALCLVKALLHFEVYLSSSPAPIDEYNLNIRHISGKSNVVPDTLSRAFEKE